MLLLDGNNATTKGDEMNALIETVKKGDNIGIYEGTSDWRRGIVEDKTWTGTSWFVALHNGVDVEKHFLRQYEKIEMLCPA